MKNPFRGLRFSLLDFHNANAGIGMKIAFAAICCIPLIYGALYLAAFYDPYGNIDKVPVVVVNKDEGWEVDGETLEAGDSVVEQLKDADALDFTYDNDEEAARAGLEAGTYYMELIIPEDFSECVASASTDEPKQARFDLVANQSANSIATTMGLSAFRVITSKVNYAIGEDFYVSIFDMIDESSAAIKVAADGSAELADGLVSAQEGSETITEALGTASTGANALDSGLGSAVSGSQALTNGLTSAQSGANSLNSGLGQLTSGLADGQAGANALASGLDQLESGSATLSAGASQLLQSIDGYRGAVSTMSSGAAGISQGLAATGQVLNGASAAVSGANQYLDGAQQAATEAINKLNSEETLTEADIRAITGAITNAQGTLATAQGVLNESLSSESEIYIERLKEGASSVADGAALINANFANDVDASGNLTIHGAVASLSSGASDLHAGIVSASDGADKLAAGTNQLYDGSVAAQQGASALSSGLGQLQSGASSLTSGLGTAQSGASALASGLVQLQSGSATLTDGLTTAADGAQELAGGLTEGYEAAQESTENSGARAEMMSEPVELDQTEYTTVTNYGSGFAPYFIALGLWVGALMCTFITKPLNGRLIASGASPLVAAFSGLVPSALIGMIQALVMAAVLQFGLHIDLLHPGPYYALCLLTAVCFAAWNQMLVSTLGLPGKFLSVVLLMLQLTSAAGTFPIQVVPEFFQAINPLLPMTYSVRALRVATTGLDLSMIAPNVWMLLLFAVIPFAVTTLHAARKRLVTLMDLHPLVQLAE